MKKAVLLLMVVLHFTVANAQDSLLKATRDTMILLEEVVITNVKLSDEEKAARRNFLILKNRVFKTYPFAKTGAERLVILNQNLAKLKSNKERKKYIKITEKYMEEEFEARLKKLSRKDGQILVKLINRQTGSSTYDLVKNLKSNWKAFWSNQTAKLFDINLKTTYDPFNVSEDFLIENILLEAFENNQLPSQPSKIPIDYVKLKHHWKKAESESVE